MATIYPLALVLLFAAGFFELSFNAMAQSLVQINARVDKRGRVLGLFNMASLGLRAFSGVSATAGTMLCVSSSCDWLMTCDLVTFFAPGENPYKVPERDCALRDSPDSNAVAAKKQGRSFTSRRQSERPLLARAR